MSLYLFPRILNTTRSFPTILAFPYADFTSAGVAQPACLAIAYYAPGSRDQYSRKVRFAMIRATQPHLSQNGM